MSLKKFSEFLPSFDRKKQKNLQETKLWLGVNDVPKNIERNLKQFFDILSKKFKSDYQNIYINDKLISSNRTDYPWTRGDKVLQIKLTDEQLPLKIATDHDMVKFKFEQKKGSSVWKSTALVNIELYPSNGVRGTKRLPRVGEKIKNPSNAQQESGTIAYFEGAMMNNPPSLEKLSEKVGFDFDAGWYYNFQQQYEAYAKVMGTPSGNIYLDSGKNESNVLIKIAKRVGLKDLKDNWNPADIWIFNGISAEKIQSDTKDFINLAEFNAYLEEMFESKKIIGVSLKKIDPPKRGKCVIVKAVDLPIVDLKKARTRFSINNNNFIFETSGEPEGFNLRVGSKAGEILSETDVKIYVEGRMKGTKVQLGAVSASLFRDEIAKGKGFDIQKDQAAILKDPMKFLEKELPYIEAHPNIIYDKTAEISPIFLKQQMSAYLTYFCKLFLALDADDLRKCYFSAIKKNDFSSIHAKVY